DSALTRDSLRGARGDVRSPAALLDMAISLTAFDHLNRHSPDDSRTGANSSGFLASLEARRELRAPTRTTQRARTVAEGLIWRFSLAFGTHSSHLLLLNA